MARKVKRLIFLGRIHRRVALLTSLGVASLTLMISVKAAYFEYLVKEPDEVVLTLTLEGFIPAEVTCGSGQFQLSVDNRSGVEELTLRLSGADGTQLREIRVPRGGGDWSEVFDLTPGTYILSEANHTNWVCQIMVH